jgi:salicylate hydroxylase
MRLPIVIAGAGVGGLTAALSFARAGYAVDVYEQALALGEVGAGIQLSPNAMKVLDALQLGRRIREVAFEPLFAAVRHHRSGATYFSSPLRSLCENRYGSPYLHVHRADLHAVLVDAATRAGVRMHLGAHVTGYRLEGACARLMREDGPAPLAALIVGADGVKSRIREQMLGSGGARFTGHVAWRGLVETDRLSPGLVKPGATVWVGPGRHVVTYYIRGGDTVNFAAFEERPEYKDESWAGQGDPLELHKTFASWHPEVSAVAALVDQPFMWALTDHDELPQWSDGAVALVGDACHPTLPYMAQGAAMALEDAFVLASLVSSHAVPEALVKYERIRKQRTTMLQGIARTNGRMFHSTGNLTDQLRLSLLRLGRVLPANLRLRPLDRIYGHDATSPDLVGST